MSKDNQRSKFTMLPFTQIDDQIIINDEIKILKKADYQSYLNGQEFINIAKQHARKIENDADSIYQERYTAGWQEGLAQSAQQQAEIIHQTLINCQIFYQQVENQLVNITIEAMRKIIANYEPNELLYKNISQNLALVHQHKKVILRISPKQVNFLQSKLTELHKIQPEIEYIDIVEDPRLEEKDCILETEVGMLNATIESQLNAIKQALLGK
ncbi:HrpE/YscL family type III secretion apparatus protein [Candidatus Arsenophonus nilaparvatae]|uniref:HrpE/YscL family type III secretion apparatus protein n=1 Tax=Candidatus Arsenophonus nilaparvatae TaxID=1247023 RepID=UPI0009DD5065|nr:HrpE/YscL family type III secretion apparatus protein [Candidatus Arsenophonus nilaparvatae]